MLMHTMVTIRKQHAIFQLYQLRYGNNYGYHFSTYRSMVYSYYSYMQMSLFKVPPDSYAYVALMGLTILIYQHCNAHLLFVKFIGLYHIIPKNTL